MWCVMCDMCDCEQVGMNWVFEHMEDADFNDPLPAPATAAAATAAATGEAAGEADEESVGLLMSLGFSLAHSLRALRATDNNMDR